MTQRDWDKELAKIDKQLASISDDELLAPTDAPRAPGSGNTGMPRGAAATAQRPAKPMPAATPSTGRASLWTYLWLTVAVAAGVGIWFWPWPAQCGPPLLGLVAATVAVSALGVWSGIASWRSRSGIAHLLSLAVVLWGAVLGAREVLPRVGYAEPTDARPGRWSCTVPAEPALPALTPPVVTPPAESPPPDVPEASVPAPEVGDPDGPGRGAVASPARRRTVL